MGGWRLRKDFVFHPCLPAHTSLPPHHHQLFDALGDPTAGWSVTATYVDIYNETLRDLLAPGGGGGVPSRPPSRAGSGAHPPRRPPSITSDRTGTVTLHSVTEAPLFYAADAADVLRRGGAARAVRGHALNDRSSRSHAVLTLHVAVPEGVAGAPAGGYGAKLHLVDLAGSERLAKTRASGAAAAEAAAINRSLTFLQQLVLNLGKGGGGGGGSAAAAAAAGATTTGRKGGKPPPPRVGAVAGTRDSKLTRLLGDAVGGRSRTLVLACAWPDAGNAAETVSTARFASAMARVSVRATRSGLAAAGAGGAHLHGSLVRLDPSLRA